MEGTSQSPRKLPHNDCPEKRSSLIWVCQHCGICVEGAKVPSSPSVSKVGELMASRLRQAPCLTLSSPRRWKHLACNHLESHPTTCFRAHLWCWYEVARPVVNDLDFN